MTLNEWISSSGLTKREAAERLNVHEVTLSRWASQKMTPRREQIATIERVTAGAVRWSDFAPTEQSV